MMNDQRRHADEYYATTTPRRQRRAATNADIGADVGAVEKATAVLAGGVAQPQQDALGRDYNGDGKGNGYNVPSLLGINAVPPYYHNGACETLACVVGNPKHRTANGRLPDRLGSARARAQLVAWLQTVTARTAPVP